MESFKSSLKLFLIMTILTGILYPLLVTGIAQVVFSHQAGGSLIKKNDQIIGSELVGQNFISAKYFWSRPSAIDYNPLPSGGSNLSLTSQDLQKKVLGRIEKHAAYLPNKKHKIPADLLFASASGLDPHISIDAALFQIGRVVQERQLNSDQEQTLCQLINDLAEDFDYKLFGQKRINVLKLNLALDQIF